MMLADDRENIERLDAYLDALATNQSDPPSINPVWVDVDERLKALDSTPKPQRSFAARLLEELMSTQSFQARRPSFSQANNGRVHAKKFVELPDRPATGPRWTLEQLGTAAIIVLTVVASVLAIGPGRISQDEEIRASLPAVNASPTAQANVVAETFLDATTERLPAGHQIIALERITLQPGSPEMVISPMDGLVILAAEAGDLVATKEGTETPLHHAEPLIIAHQEVALRVIGPDEGIVAAVYVISAFVDASGFDSDPLVHRVDRLIETSANDLPGGSARITVERLTLAPGASLPSYEGRPWTWAEVEEGELGLTLEGDRLPFRWKSGTERTFRFGQYLPPVQAGTRMTIRNAGESPLVLNRLTILPQEEAGLPIGTPTA